MEIHPTERVQVVVKRNRRMASGEYKTYSHVEFYTRKVKQPLPPALIAEVRAKAAASVQHKRILADHPEIKNAYQLHKVIA